MCRLLRYFEESMIHRFLIGLLATLFLVIPEAKAQQYAVLSGVVLGTQQEPIPYAHIRSRRSNEGVIADINGKFELRLEVGYHQIIIQAMGYKDRVEDVTLQNNVEKVFYLEQDAEMIDAVTVGTRRRNIADEVMREVIKMRPVYTPEFSAVKTDCYIRGIEQPVVRKKRFGKEVVDSSEAYERMSVFEADIELYRRYPDQIKEIRRGVTKRGNTLAIFYQSNTEGTFDFYRNSVYTPRIAPNVFVSPVSNSANLAYKFDLIRSYYQSGKKRYEIRFEPRQLANAALSGSLVVEDSTFKVLKWKLAYPKHTLQEYLTFEVEQQFTELEGKLMVNKQMFYYTTKDANWEYLGKTVVRYRNMVLNPVLPKRFFNAELSRTEQKAYEQDSAYWKKVRLEPLTEEEIRAIQYRDSIHEAHNKKEFLDSVDAEFNRVTLLKLLWNGQGYINREKKTTIEFAPVIGLFDPLMVGGYRARAYLQYFRKFENRKDLTVIPFASYGFENRDLKFQLFASHLYNPVKRGVVGIDFGRQFDLVNPFDAYINLLKPQNLYEKDYVRLIHNREIINGLHFHSRFYLEKRRPLHEFDFGFLEDDIFPNSPAINFEPHTAVTATFWLSYTPRQLYVMEPNEKIILGSRYPTFTVKWRTGVPRLFNSVLDYNYLEFRVSQDITVGVLGESKYRITAGKVLENNEMRLVDFKYQRQGDPFLFTNPLETYQLTDSTFPTFDWYLEAHYYHKFNGFLTSKIPFMKKSGIQTVAGAGFLSAPEKDYLHTEAFFGADRILRIGRERFRLGIYYAVGVSNWSGFNRGIKFSLEYFNRQADSWNF